MGTDITTSFVLAGRPPKIIAGLVWVVKRVRHMIEAASDITIVFVDHSAWYNGFLLLSSGDRSSAYGQSRSLRITSMVYDSESRSTIATGRTYWWVVES